MTIYEVFNGLQELERQKNIVKHVYCMSIKNDVLIIFQRLSKVPSVMTEDLSLTNLSLNALNIGIRIIKIIKNALIGPKKAKLAQKLIDLKYCPSL